MKIYTKQIDEASLTAFVTGAMGTSLSGQLNSYLNAGGYLGVNVVYASGGAQIISGGKTFDISPNVPYSGTTGQAPSRLYVDNQILANGVNLSGGFNNISGSLFETGKILSFVSVTGSSGIQTPNFTGIGGTLIRLSGNFVLISGAGGGSSSNGDGINLSGNLFSTGNLAILNANGVGINLSGRLVATGALLSAVQVTGSTLLQNPNFSGIGGTLVLQSGSFVLISGGAGGGSSNVSITGSNPIASPNFTGIGGVMLLQSGSIVVVSGNTSDVFNTINTYNITGTGNISITNTSSGSMTNTFNSYNTFTGNFNTVSFFFDPVITGLNVAESFIGGMGFYFTGAAFSCRSSGTGPINGGILSGKLYQVDSNNTEQTLFNFTFNTGIIYSGSPVFNTYVTGKNRIGLSITNTMSGIQKFSVGAFGGNYV